MALDGSAAPSANSTSPRARSGSSVIPAATIGTVKKAIELLRSEGLVRTVIGRGIFVSRPGG